MKFGYQLYSARSLCGSKADLLDTMEKIAAMGYDGVEFYTYAGIPAAELKAELARLGLEGFNSHVQIERWKADPEGEIRYAVQAGIPCLTIPYILPEMRNEAGYAQIKAMIPQLLKWCTQYGVKLVYHNHDFEFSEDGKGTILDGILATDPSLGLELDTFWTFYAGLDPVAYMESKKDRLRLIHIKDYQKQGIGMTGCVAKPVFCAIGAGKMDNKSVVDWARANDIPWVCVEQDNSLIHELEAARLSIAAMKEM